MSVPSNDAASRALRGDPQTAELHPTTPKDVCNGPIEGFGITLEDIKKTLGAFYKVQHSVSAGEYVFGWCGRAQIDIRIHTTIDKQTQRLRPSGTDAIRIVLFDLRARRKIQPWTVTLPRSGTHLLDRLQKEAGAALLRASIRPYCPTCGQDTLCITAPKTSFKAGVAQTTAARVRHLSKGSRRSESLRLSNRPVLTDQVTETGGAKATEKPSRIFTNVRAIEHLTVELVELRIPQVGLCLGIHSVLGERYLQVLCLEPAVGRRAEIPSDVGFVNIEHSSALWLVL